jgi:hypothetical protein
MQNAVSLTDNVMEVEVGICSSHFSTIVMLAKQAELMTVASVLRGLPNHGNQPIAESATQELAVLFESFSAMLARNATAAASRAAISAGAMAAAMLPPSPYKTLASSSPTLSPFGGNVLLKSTAEHSFLTISREVEVSYALLHPLPFFSCFHNYVM